MGPDSAEKVAAIDDTCSACGERNPAGSQFCLFCGVFLGWDDPTTDQPAAVPSRPTGPARTGSEPTGSDPSAPAAGARVTSTVPLPVVDDLGAAPAGPIVLCPSCGLDNQVAHRFCAKCGTRLHVSAPARVAIRHIPWWRRWWQRLTNPERRASGRAYRRSLPPLYRWRRTGLGLLGVLAVGSGLVVAGHNPAGLARSAWHNLRGDVTKVEIASAVPVPARSAVGGTSADAAVDGATDTPWTTKWLAPTSPPACGADTGSGGLQLTIAPTRIRQIRVTSGVTDPSQRTLQQLPRTLQITTSDGTCISAELSQVATSQTVQLDTKTNVTTVTIRVAATFAAKDPRAKPVVSLSEISLWARPS